MISCRLARPSASERALAPRLEALESRQLLASQPLVTVSEVASGSSYILLIVGTNRNDSIFIADNGKNTAGSVVVAAGGGVSYTAQHPLAAIEVFTGPGKDKLDYELRGDMQPNASEFILATRGSGGLGLPGSLKTIKGGGSLQVTANIAGKVATDAHLLIAVQPDPTGATTLNATATGEVDGQLSAVIANAIGGTSKKVGPVTYNFNSSSTIGTNGAINVGAMGGASRNLLYTNYVGTNNGRLTVTETGSGAKDFITAGIYMNAGSTGTVGQATAPAEIGSGGKNAQNRFLVTRGADSTSTTGTYAEVVAAPKKGVVVRTRNVLNMTQAADSIVS